jgi:hypothetical protein
MIEQDYRLPTSLESQILSRLLGINFRGRDSLTQQLEGLLVRQIDQEGSLALKVTTEARVDLPDGVAVEARYSDSEAVDSWEPKVNLLLHIANGALRILEIYKDDGSKIRRVPDPRELQLFSRYEIPEKCDNR